MSTSYGLALDLGGAPNTPHWIPGVPGSFRPEDPSPIGEDGEGLFAAIDFAEATRLSEDPSVPLKIVELASGDVERLREQSIADLDANRSGASSALATATGAEPELVREAALTAQAPPVKESTVEAAALATIADAPPSVLSDDPAADVAVTTTKGAE